MSIFKWFNCWNLIHIKDVGIGTVIFHIMSVCVFHKPINDVIAKSSRWRYEIYIWKNVLLSKLKKSKAYCKCKLLTLECDFVFDESLFLRTRQRVDNRSATWYEEYLVYHFILSPTDQNLENHSWSSSSFRSDDLHHIVTPEMKLQFPILCVRRRRHKITRRRTITRE